MTQGYRLWISKEGKLIFSNLKGGESDVVIGIQVVNVESVEEQDPSIFVELKWKRSDFKYARTVNLKVELFGEELKHLLKGHTFFFRELREKDGVRKL
jgi:hypothetical protein